MPETAVPDTSYFKLVVYLIGSMALVAIVGIVTLSAAGREVPEAMPNIAIAALSYLGGMLGPKPGASGGSSEPSTADTVAAAVGRAALASMQDELLRQAGRTPGSAT